MTDEPNAGASAVVAAPAPAAPAPAAPAPGSVPPVPKAPVEIAAFPVSLDDFCREHSRTAPGVEMLAAFHHTETKAGHARGLAADFAKRFAAFGARPVA